MKWWPPTYIWLTLIAGYFALDGNSAACVMSMICASYACENNRLLEVLRHSAEGGSK